MIDAGADPLGVGFLVDKIVPSYDPSSWQMPGTDGPSTAQPAAPPAPAQPWTPDTPYPPATAGNASGMLWLFGSLALWLFFKGGK